MFMLVFLRRVGTGRASAVLLHAWPLLSRLRSAQRQSGSLTFSLFIPIIRFDLLAMKKQGCRQAEENETYAVFVLLKTIFDLSIWLLDKCPLWNGKRRALVALVRFDGFC